MPPPTIFGCHTVDATRWLAGCGVDDPAAGEDVTPHSVGHWHFERPDLERARWTRDRDPHGECTLSEEQAEHEQANAHGPM